MKKHEVDLLALFALGFRVACADAIHESCQRMAAG